MMSTAEKILKQEMSKRLIKGSEFPPFFAFEKPGDEILGKVVAIRPHPINPATNVITVRKLDGTEYLSLIHI